AASTAFASALAASKAPVRRSDKHDLEVWGEDFQRFPQRRPCASLGQQQPACFTPAPEDVMRPLKPLGAESVISCDADVLDDIDARIVGMSAAQKESYFA